VASKFEFGGRKSILSPRVLDYWPGAGIGLHRSAARWVCAEVRLILGVVLEHTLEVGGGEGGELDAVVDDHIHEVAVVSFDA
jgi:hypothetical protein